MRHSVVRPEPTVTRPQKRLASPTDFAVTSVFVRSIGFDTGGNMGHAGTCGDAAEISAAMGLLKRHAPEAMILRAFAKERSVV